MEQKIVDVEKVMEQIKQQALEMEMKAGAVEADWLQTQKADMIEDINIEKEFIWDKFWNQLADTNRAWQVKFTTEAETVEKQNAYNANSVRTLNEIAVFIQDMEKVIIRQNEINTRLNREISELSVNSVKEKMEVCERENQYLKNEVKLLKNQIKALKDMLERNKGEQE